MVKYSRHFLDDMKFTFTERSEQMLHLRLKDKQEVRS